MNIGDKVRFLTETGGGIVKGFKDKNTVIVASDEGFDIPMLITNVVVVGNTDALNFERKPTKKETPRSDNPSASAQEKGLLNSPKQDSKEASTPQQEEKAPAPIVQEFAGHEALNVHLAFLPVDIKSISTTVMEAWLVNDSNYFITYAWASIGSGSQTLFDQGTLEPNSVVFLREFTRDMYNQLEHISVQLFAWKRGKPYRRKAVIDTELRIDTVKFFKLHTFRETPFFEEPALLYDIARDDRPARPVQ